MIQLDSTALYSVNTQYSFICRETVGVDVSVLYACISDEALKLKKLIVFQVCSVLKSSECISVDTHYVVM